MMMSFTTDGRRGSRSTAKVKASSCGSPCQSGIVTMLCVRSASMTPVTAFTGEAGGCACGPTTPHMTSATTPAIRRLNRCCSVAGGLLGVVDDQDVHRLASFYKSQPELIPHGIEDSLTLGVVIIG